MKLKVRNGLVAVSSVAAIALGVALALPPSSPTSSDASEDSGQNGVEAGDEEQSLAKQSNQPEDAALGSAEFDEQCFNEAGEPLPTVSNPCMANAGSGRALALNCEAIESNQEASPEDRRWYEEHCTDDYVVQSENQHGVVVRYAGSIFYLGRDCDARSDKFGPGRWEWANGGWSIILDDGEEFSFARRDAPLSEMACRS